MRSFPDASSGSSPLARGLRDRVPRRPPQRGIIPARAGFTRPTSLTGLRLRDHPRSRGVYTHTSRLNSISDGSSPLARGLHQQPVPGEAARGIIPARAGFTRASYWAVAACADHPRSRGVYEDRAVVDAYVGGSSPLARGLRTELLKPCVRTRIIPARAGFTRLITGSPTQSRDHPRSRGVYVAFSSARELSPGSSPLARGLRCPRRMSCNP